MSARSTVALLLILLLAATVIASPPDVVSASPPRRLGDLLSLAPDDWTGGTGFPRSLWYSDDELILIRGNSGSDLTSHWSSAGYTTRSAGSFDHWSIRGAHEIDLTSNQGNLVLDEMNYAAARRCSRDQRSTTACAEVRSRWTQASRRASGP